MSTNEELAILAKGGDRDAQLKLWNNMRGLAKRKARGNEDLLQSGFLALVDALERFSPERGSFLACYKFALKNAFTVARYGGRGDRFRNDPLHSYVSLDVPIGDGEDDSALADFLEDKTAAGPFSEIEREECSAAVQAALQMLSKQEREVIRLRYWLDKTQAEAAQELNVPLSEVKKTEAAALRRLRAPSISRTLREFL